MPLLQEEIFVNIATSFRQNLVLAKMSYMSVKVVDKPTMKRSWMGNV